jgi:hypothetical protein
LVHTSPLQRSCSSARSKVTHLALTLPAACLHLQHTCWGILNAPASGLALAELIVDGAASSCDLAPFDPARLAARR